MLVLQYCSIEKRFEQFRNIVSDAIQDMMGRGGTMRNDGGDNRYYFEKKKKKVISSIRIWGKNVHVWAKVIMKKSLCEGKVV